MTITLLHIFLICAALWLFKTDALEEFRQCGIMLRLLILILLLTVAVPLAAAFIGSVVSSLNWIVTFKVFEL